jgi:hypothetical protein
VIAIVDGMAPDVPRNGQFAMLCVQLPKLRRLYRGPVGAQRLALLEDALAAARAGEPIDAHLKQLGLPGSAEPGAHDPERGSLPPRLGESASAYLPGLYVCPRDACTRQEHREVGTDLPTCAVFDQALRFTQER